MATWPVALPQLPAVGALSGGPQSNKVSFQPDAGPQIDRRRGTAVAHIRNIRLPLITDAQLATFVSFFETDLKDGVLPFVWPDPITSVSHNWKFAGGESPYSVNTLMPDRHELSFTLMRLP